MGDFSSWLQDNWYDLGTLLTLMGFLVAGVWFAHNFLKAMRTFQDHTGALLKLLLASPANHRLKNPPAKDALPEGISSWLETPAIALAKPEGKETNRFVLACSGLLAWLKGPMRTAGAARRVVRWLQAPVGG